jgi:uncharacterized SAM-binding protein YcdF (DUF218 family)
MELSFGFILKKALGTILMPLPLIFITLFIIYVRLQRSMEKKALGIALGILFLLSYDPFADFLLSSVENRYKPMLHPPHSIRFVHVLGSSHHTRNDFPETSQLTSEAMVRITEGIRLWRALPEGSKLIVSGYKGIYADPITHAEHLAHMAHMLGVPYESIIKLPHAKDTAEEASAAKQIVGDAPLILVTSAYHMPRAVNTFTKTGIDVHPAPTFFLTDTSHIRHTQILNAFSLYKSTLFTYETIGSIWQRLKKIFNS